MGSTTGMAASTRRPGRSGESGFTVSELLLVAVFIVGLLVVALNSANGIERDNRVSDCQTELRNLKLAVAQYEAAKGSFPAEVSTVVDAGFAERNAVDGWKISKGGGVDAPTYVPTGSC